jgi:pyruvate,water dikinase
MAGYYNWSLYDFDDERDLEPYYKVWILFSTFCVPALKPFDLWLHVAPCQRTMIGAIERLSMPMPMLHDHRLKDGYWYFSPLELPEEEVKRREPLFRKKMTPWIEDPDKIWRGKMIPELMNLYEPLKKVDVEKVSNYELLEHFEDWLQVVVRMWDIHFDSMFPGYALFGLFEDLCREQFGIDGRHPQFKALMGGFDSREFQCNREIWRLASRARELRLEQLFQATSDDDKLLSKLEESDAGKNWLQEFHKFIFEHGARVPRFYRASDPSWWEKPSGAIPDIRRAIAKGGDFVLDKQRKRLTEEREKAERELLSRVPVEKREMFEKLMRGAQWLSMYEEDHTFYCELYTSALGRRVTIEIGRRFARLGMLDEPEDIYYLLPDEVRVAMMGMENRCPMHKTVRIRKQQYQDFLHIEPPFFLGDPSVLPGILARSPHFRLLTALPIVMPELKADLYGAGSAAGVAEGIARVVIGETEMGQVQPGEILVAPLTHVYWTPLFGIVKAVVTDGGGALAHALICGREYGIPVVAGTIEATRKIKTGDRIKVDGNNCCVYILSRKE